MGFEKVTDNIFRLCVPFENIYTSVFAVEADGKWLLFDSGSDESDARTIVIPAIKELGFVPDVLFASHSHGDHAGGMDTLKAEYPDATVKMFNDNSAEDGELVLGCLRLVSFPGHSADSGGLFDERTKTLLSGDCFQLWGVGRYGIAALLYEDYPKSVEKALEMGVFRLVASHDYYPLGFLAEGDEVEVYLKKCVSCLNELMDFVRENNDPAIKFNKLDPDRPPVPQWMINNLLNK